MRKHENLVQKYLNFLGYTHPFLLTCCFYMFYTYYPLEAGIEGIGNWTVNYTGTQSFKITFDSYLYWSPKILEFKLFNQAWFTSQADDYHWGCIQIYRPLSYPLRSLGLLTVTKSFKCVISLSLSLFLSFFHSPLPKWFSLSFLSPFIYLFIFLFLLFFIYLFICYQII